MERQVAACYPGLGACLLSCWQDTRSLWPELLDGELLDRV